MYRALAALVILAPTSALASTDAFTLDPSWQSPLSRQIGVRSETITHQRGFDMEVGFRGRMVSVPKSIMDIWYFDEEDNGHPRPRIGGYALGLEFVVKNEQGANGLFYFEYMASTMGEGYWDDREEPPNHLDGDYIVPSPGLGMVALGANYGYEVFFLRTADTDGNFGLSFLVGGGLGIGFLVGELERWGPRGAVPGYARHDQGEESDGLLSVPRVLPIVDLNAGLRFNFADRVVLRVEGGLHTMLYYGASVGLMF